jgi:hypothetical protein
MYKFQRKLKNFKLKLKEWNKNTFGNIFQAQRDLEQQMKTIQQTILAQNSIEELLKEEAQVKQQLEEWYAQEEILW